MIRNSRARASKSGDVKTESINSAESSFVMSTGYDRNKKPAVGSICRFREPFRGATYQDIA
jgi:hypothetical protein